MVMSLLWSNIEPEWCAATEPMPIESPTNMARPAAAVVVPFIALLPRIGAASVDNSAFAPSLRRPRQGAVLGLFHRHKNVVAVGVLLFAVVPLHTFAFDDIELPRALP